VEDTRLVLVGALDSTTRDRFRTAAVIALDLAASAGVSLVLDCRAAGFVDDEGAAMLVALGRTARSLSTPVRIEAAPIQLRGKLELAAAIELFEWREE
jgi:anti-anti-sigma regulatory factor